MTERGPSVSFRVDRRELLAQGRYAEALAAVAAVAPSAVDYPAARLLGLRTLLEQARFADLADWLAATEARAYTATGAGAELACWRAYVQLLTLTGDDPTGTAERLLVPLQADRPDRVYQPDRVDRPDLADRADGSADGADGPPSAQQVVAADLATRAIRLQVVYAERPVSALPAAADAFAEVAHAYRRLGRHLDSWQATLSRAATLRAVPYQPDRPVLHLLDDLVSRTRSAGDPLAEAQARIARLEVTATARLSTPGAADLTMEIAETAAIEELLTDGGHAFPAARAGWPLTAVLLRHGAEPAVDLARQCAEQFHAAGADHLAHEVWRALHQWHAWRGETIEQQAAAEQAGRTGAGQGWQMYDLIDAVGTADGLFRAGQVGRARALVAEALTRAPHRAARVSLRVMLAANLSAVGRDVDARATLDAARDDLAQVGPTPLTAQVLGQLAALSVASDPAAALRLTGDAADAARALADHAEAGRFLAQRLLLRAQIRHRQGSRPVVDTAGADDFAAALTEVEPLTTMEGRRALATAHQIRGQAAFLDDDPQTWSRHFALAKEIARACQLRPELGFTLAYEAMAGLSLARRRADPAAFDAVTAVFHDAHRAFREADLNAVAWRARWLAADAQMEAAARDPDPDGVTRRLAEAAAGFEETVWEIDVLRGAAAGPDAADPVEDQLTRIGFGVDKQQVYRAGFTLAVDHLGDVALASRWLERMKGRALLDALAAATLPQQAVAGHQLLVAERELRAAARRATRYAQLADLHRRLDQLFERMAADATTAGYAALRQARPPQWSQVRAALVAEADQPQGRRLVVAQYHCPPEGPPMLIASAPDWDAPRLVRLDVDLPTLADFAAATFRTSGGVRMLMQDSPDGGYADWAGFAGLVAPLAGWAGADDVVYLVPHGILHDLPLHTLPVDGRPDGVPLGRRNPVCYAPSLSVLLHTLGRPRPPAVAARPAVFADPSGDLPWARAEAATIAATLRAGEVVSGAAMTRDAVLTALRDATTVHIAGHARASATDGLVSGVDLAGGDLLTAADVLVNPVGADLVVLSGCETGVSQRRPGDELLGLPRALLHGGARAALTTQWRVDDRSAQLLLTAFHRGDRTLSRADALRQAMRDTATQPGRAHFYHWAGFVLTGDWR
ncbi:CHAT domain-containing protein [Solwaraspora sp. WMMB335]|uniref:CHAT domain-containing protein n=1 Tax=Solwaraspora sp. WMMB335 TaxID=3404118 RepID=UPI003B93C153